MTTLTRTVVTIATTVAGLPDGTGWTIYPTGAVEALYQPDPALMSSVVVALGDPAENGYAVHSNCARCGAGVDFPSLRQHGEPATVRTPLLDPAEAIRIAVQHATLHNQPDPRIGPCGDNGGIPF